jgi:hypothetical protein
MASHYCRDALISHGRPFIGERHNSTSNDRRFYANFSGELGSKTAGALRGEIGGDENVIRPDEPHIVGCEGFQCTA